MSKKSSVKDFEIMGKLGQGSFGSVYKVRRKVDSNIYVMKMIKISQLNKASQQESIGEVRILASLDNPYIVKYYDSFIETQTLHIIMEFCDKGDLSRHIKNQMGRLLPENKIWKYFIQMCLGLEYLHSQNVLHRDIKSMNVFLVREDSIRIGDLGVAKVLSNTAAFAHTMVGTPYYLSPELCEEKPYNVKSDVWALGCVLYEMCTLKHPFEGVNQGALILKIIRASFAPISSQYSEELVNVVNLCLAKDYRNRPTVSEILQRPGMKDRAFSLSIIIPSGSILSDSYIPARKAENNIYHNHRMDVIEEEKNSHFHDDNEIKQEKAMINKKERPVTGRPSSVINLADIVRPPKAPVIQKVDKAVIKELQVPLSRPTSGKLLINIDKQIQSSPKLISPIIPKQTKGDLLQNQELYKKQAKNLSPYYNALKPKLLLQPKNRLLKAVSHNQEDILEVQNLPDIPKPKKVGIKDLREKEINLRPLTQPSSDQKLSPLAAQSQRIKSNERPAQKSAAQKEPFILPKKIQPHINISYQIHDESQVNAFAISNAEISKIQNEFRHNESVEEQPSPNQSNLYEEEKIFEQTKSSLQKRLSENEKTENDLENIIAINKAENIKKIGKQNFMEIYGLLKAKVISQDEPTKEELEVIDGIIKSKVSNNYEEIQYSLFKILSLEEKLAKSQELSRKIRYDLL
ncbi:unnamed protein product [Blepharisma stoltei]|uniref:non-specific serine/threonine protein kinase n=1 Tax=Blepharisma stoltei TaxID=1481888 RepID=A0AAU9JGN0_9CILI|nr:unnamed protein product [Blepharisma stoltei]